MNTIAILPKVCIIIPMFNAASFVSETLQSAIGANYPNLEIFVIDDGSTDGSYSIAKTILESSGRPFKLFSKHNTGEADSVNFGFARCQAEFALILSADDAIDPELLTRSVEILRARKELVATYPNWKMIDTNSNFIREIRPKNYSPSLLIGDLVCLPGPGAVIRSSSVKPRGLRNPELRFVSDLEQWMQLATAGELCHIDETLASWRMHPEQQTVTGRGKRASLEMINLVEDFFSQQSLPPKYRHLAAQARSMAYYRAALESLYSKQVSGRRLLLASLFRLFSRDKQVNKSRRSLILIALIFLNPLGRLTLRDAQRLRLKLLLWLSSRPRHRANRKIALYS